MILLGLRLWVVDGKAQRKDNRIGALAQRGVKLSDERVLRLYKGLEKYRMRFAQLEREFAVCKAEKCAKQG